MAPMRTTKFYLISKTRRGASTPSSAPNIREGHGEGVRRRGIYYFIFHLLLLVSLYLSTCSVVQLRFCLSSTSRIASLSSQVNSINIKLDLPFNKHVEGSAAPAIHVACALPRCSTAQLSRDGDRRRATGLDRAHPQPSVASRP